MGSNPSASVGTSSEQSLILIEGGNFDNLVLSLRTIVQYHAFNDRLVVDSTAELTTALLASQGGKGVIIGHGSEIGIQIGELTISWKAFGGMLDASPVTEFYLASCYSAKVIPHTSKRIFGYEGAIDAYVAGVDISKQLLLTQSSTNRASLNQIVEQEKSAKYKFRSIVICNPLTYKVYTAVLVDRGAPNNDYTYEHYVADHGANWADFVRDDVSDYLQPFTNEFDVEVVITRVDFFNLAEDPGDFDGSDILGLMADKREGLETNGYYFDLVIGYMYNATISYWGLAIPDANVWNTGWNSRYQNSLFGASQLLDEYPDASMSSLFCHEISHIFNGRHVDNNNDPNRWTVMDYADAFEMDTNEVTWDQESKDEIDPNVDFYDGNTDLDGDGMSDDFEYTYYPQTLNPSYANDADLDPDNDGLTNLQEFQHGTDPMMTDSDSDGVLDGEEVNIYGTDPSVADWGLQLLSEQRKIEINLYDGNPYYVKASTEFKLTQLETYSVWLTFRTYYRINGGAWQFKDRNPDLFFDFDVSETIPISQWLVSVSVNDTVELYWAIILTNTGRIYTSEGTSNTVSTTVEAKGATILSSTHMLQYDFHNPYGTKKIKSKLYFNIAEAGTYTFKVWYKRYIWAPGWPGGQYTNWNLVRNDPIDYEPGDYLLKDFIGQFPIQDSFWGKWEIYYGSTKLSSYTTWP
ncbi:MAG: hypothetical protein ACFFAJ_11910 [Candidatus Hodarchaeota archaeon]